MKVDFKKPVLIPVFNNLKYLHYIKSVFPLTAERAEGPCWALCALCKLQVQITDRSVWLVLNLATDFVLSGKNATSEVPSPPLSCH